MPRKNLDKPFPLKKYYILYAGIGGVIFYSLLFSFIIHAERQTLYDQYINNLVDKAQSLYHDINRDYLIIHNISFEDINNENTSNKKKLREEINSIILTDFTLATVKLFNKGGIVLYDHVDQANEGKPYNARHEAGFKQALKGKTASTLEQDNEGKRFMEVYLPIYENASKEVIGILELYEDVSRFEEKVFNALRQGLVIPTIIFLLFNFVLFLIVAKADKIISINTKLLLRVRKNMEKYLSSSAIDAIYDAVKTENELFQGKRQKVVIFFSDIRGFTSFSEQNEPEVAVRGLNEIFELQAKIINEHGGIIDKFVGDEIMSLFPAKNPSAAVKAALNIVETINSDQKIFFKVGISVHTGEAVVGSIGTEDRRDYTAIGNTINTGARLCSASGPGEVIITSSVFDLLTDDLQAFFSPKETLQLKGKTEKIIAYSSMAKR